MAETPFTVNPTLSGIAVAYKNEEMIADQVLPRVAPVGTKEFKYTLFPKGDPFTVPNTLVGRRGRPNVVEFGGTETTAMTADYGLEDEIPQDDIDQAAAARALNPDLATPQAHAAEMVSDLLVLDREVRTAGLVFNPATYDAGGKVQLAGAAQWSHPDSDPARAIQDALDAMVMRANILTLGQATWSAIRRHPKVVKAINRNDGDSGLVSRQALADLLELEEIIIGRAWVNTGKPGQTEALVRTWGKHAALTRRNKLADRKRGVTFGYTVPYGARTAWEKPDHDIGLRGGVRVRVGESVKELITCPDAGYFFQDAVA